MSVSAKLLLEGRPLLLRSSEVSLWGGKDWGGGTSGVRTQTPRAAQRGEVEARGRGCGGSDEARHCVKNSVLGKALTVLSDCMGFASADKAPRMLRMDAIVSSLLCENCHSPAEVFCTCSYRPTLLCSICLAPHQASRAIHFAAPLSALNSLDEYMRKFMQINSIKAVLRRQIESFDQAIQEIHKAFEDTLAFIEHSRDEVKRMFESKKEQITVDIQLALEEAEDCLQKRSTPTSPLAHAFWTQPSECLQLFQYSLEAPDLDKWLSSWLTYRFSLQDFCDLDRGPPASKHIHSYLTPPLVYVEPTRLKIFNIGKEGWDPYPLDKQIAVDDGSRYIWTDSGLFCSGSTH